MTIQRKHRGVILCAECKDNLVSLFVFAQSGNGLDKVEGFAYCHHCKKVYKTSIMEV